MKLCADQLCERKGQLLPLTDFPKNNHIKDGRHSYCFPCSRRRRNESARKARIIKARRQALLIQRKPAVKAPRPKPIDKVLLAIQRGHNTRALIRAKTKYGEDRVGDLLAELWDSGSVRIKRVGEEAIFLVSKAA